MVLLRFLRRNLFLFLLGLVAVFFLWWISREAESSVGREAPDFHLLSENSGELRLSERRGHMVLLNFWASWCQPCVEKWPQLEELYRALHGEGLEIWSITAEEPAAVQDFLKENPVSFRILYDVGGGVTEGYGVREYPAMFLVDADGSIEYFTRELDLELKLRIRF